MFKTFAVWSVIVGLACGYQFGYKTIWKLFYEVNEKIETVMLYNQR